MIRRHHRSGIAIALAAILVGCSNGTEPEAVANDNVVLTAVAGDTIELRPGQSATLAPGIMITFGGVVSDSRCPVGVTCVWEGDAHVRLSAEERGERHSIDLHTALEADEATLADFRLRLIEVNPSPVYGRPTEPDDYSIRLSISRG